MVRGVVTVGGSLAVSRVSKIIVETLMFDLKKLLQALRLIILDISHLLESRST